MSPSAASSLVLPRFECAGATLRSVNAALAQLLGTTPAQMERQPVRAWLLGLPDEVTQPVQVTLTAIGVDGPWRLVTDLWRHEDGLWGEVLSHEPTTLDGAEYDYAVMAQDGPDSPDGTAGPFGRVRALEFIGGQVDASRLGGRCFEVLHRRSAPCLGCPLAAPTRVEPEPDDDERVSVTTAVRHGPAARLRVRRVALSTLTMLVRVRMERLSAEHKLSDREREVLLSLVLGQSLEAFAAATGISKRTVVFHKTNLLRKLGVDSQREFISKLLDVG